VFEKEKTDRGQYTRDQICHCSTCLREIFEYTDTQLEEVTDIILEALERMRFAYCQLEDQHGRIEMKPVMPRLHGVPIDQGECASKPDPED
jgi:hypothetical protein